MSESAGEKTEQPSHRKLEAAWSKGQFARSPEIQTVFVLGAGFLGLMFSGREAWRVLSESLSMTLGHLHEVPMTRNAMQGYVIQGALVVGKCVWPVMAAVVVGGLLAGGGQSRFRTASEALAFNWNRLDPLAGAKRILSAQSLIRTGISILKLAVIVGFTWNVIQSVLSDPIFFASVGLHRIGEFMVMATSKILIRTLFALGIIAAIDYGYQLWHTHHEMMMTKQEVKDEAKNSEPNPQVRAQQRRRRQSNSKRKMLLEVQTADVVVTNPTHLAIALRYDRRTMKAPKIVAKGSRLNALQIREIARAHQVPILENKPLARFMFKHGRVGSEIPSQVYAAVAEVLAWVYRTNAYRYYREQRMATR